MRPISLAIAFLGLLACGCTSPRNAPPTPPADQATAHRAAAAARSVLDAYEKALTNESDRDRQSRANKAHAYVTWSRRLSEAERSASGLPNKPTHDHVTRIARLLRQTPDLPPEARAALQCHLVLDDRLSVAQEESLPQEVRLQIAEELTENVNRLDEVLRINGAPLTANVLQRRLDFMRFRFEVTNDRDRYVRWLQDECDRLRQSFMNAVTLEQHAAGEYELARINAPQHPGYHQLEPNERGIDRRLRAATVIVDVQDQLAYGGEALVVAFIDRRCSALERLYTEEERAGMAGARERQIQRLQKVSELLRGRFGYVDPTSFAIVEFHLAMHPSPAAQHASHER